MQAYTPGAYKTLGLFIPLIVVNCIVLGRAEAFAGKHNVVDSLLDGLGIGLGFTCSLTVIGMIREVLGSGSIFGWKFIQGDGMLAFVMAPGVSLCSSTEVLYTVPSGRTPTMTVREPLKPMVTLFTA